jgi:hypothetical protein
MEDQSVIDQQIDCLGLSSEFVNTSRLMNFDRISEILKISPMELIGREGFNYNWLGELVKFLSKHQLTHLLQPMPGSIRG